MLKALRAFLRGDQATPKGGDALAALDRRVAALEAAVSDVTEAVEAEAERAARWADMSTQLRRFLGRLDAHAGHDIAPTTAPP
jgi:hypothetical protein